MTPRLAAAAVLLSALGACQSIAAPAVLSSSEPAAVDRLKAALARAMGQASVELGPGDPTQTSTISVLPRPPSPQEDRSLAKPTLFRLELENGVCVLVREDTGVRHVAEGVSCRAVSR